METIMQTMGGEGASQMDLAVMGGWRALSICVGGCGSGGGWGWGLIRPAPEDGWSGRCRLCIFGVPVIEHLRGH